jgi:hypothetical protein
MPLSLRKRRSDEFNSANSIPPAGHVQYPEEASDNDKSSEDAEQPDGRFVLAAPPAYEAEATNQADLAREPRLIRGLQVPSRLSFVTSGFKFPMCLARYEITRAQWSVFTGDIKRHASLSSSQWAKTIGCGVGTFLIGGILISWFAIIPAAIVGHHMRKDREQLNIFLANQNGALKLCLDRWNKSFFRPKGLVVRLDVPGKTQDLRSMDISTSRFFGHRQMSADPSAVPGAAEDVMDQVWREYEDESKAHRVRRRAARKGRIVIMPLNERQPTKNGTLTIRLPLSDSKEVGETGNFDVAPSSVQP